MQTEEKRRQTRNALCCKKSMSRKRTSGGRGGRGGGGVESGILKREFQQTLELAVNFINIEVCTKNHTHTYVLV